MKPVPLPETPGGNDERRKRPRLGTNIAARYMLANREEYRGTVVDVSGTGLVLIGSHTGAIGDRVVIYVEEEIGRVEGVIVRHVHGGFAIHFRQPSRTADVLGRLVLRGLMGNLASVR